MVVANKQNLAHTRRGVVRSLSAFALELGSPNGTDPIPSSNYMVFLDNRHTPLQRFVACVRWKTIKYREQPDGGDGRSAFAVDDNGKALTLAAIGRILHMKLPQVSKACKEAEDLGIVRREGKKIFLVGDCPAPDMAKARRKVNCTDNLPPSLLKEVEGWPAERKADFYGKWELAVNHVNNIHANRIAEDRAEAIQLYDSILSHFGLERNHLPTRRKPKPVEIPDQLRLFIPRASEPGGYLYRQPVRTDHKSPLRTNSPSLCPESTERVRTQTASSLVADRRPEETKKNTDAGSSKATSSPLAAIAATPIDDAAPFVAEVQAAMMAAGNPFHAGDVATAHKWAEWGISATVARRAIFLGTLRQFIAAKNSDAEPGVHSLRYFDRILAEVQETEVSDGYWDHVENRLRRERAKPSCVSVPDAQ